VYLLSGLGADRRVFDFISLDYSEVHYVQWITPSQDETITGYARRLLPQITNDRPILIGVSFGGIMAVELAKLMDTEKVLIISSIKTRFDAPWRFKLSGMIRLNNVIPTTVFKMVNPFTYWLFGVATAQERKLLASIIEDTDVAFLRWAIGVILQWSNEEVLPNVVHVHGTRDRIFPIHTANFVVEGGGHLMIVSKAAEVDQIIKNVIVGA